MRLKDVITVEALRQSMLGNQGREASLEAYNSVIDEVRPYTDMFADGIQAGRIPPVQAGMATAVLIAIAVHLKKQEGELAAREIKGPVQ